tara:strand:- start:6141 stop:6512 length:372 start_codon:yes stop_codon:yes gene_type:complete
MRRQYYHINVTGNAVTKLIERNVKADYDIYNMTICNKHNTDSVAIDLFLRKRTELRVDPNNYNQATDTFTDIYLVHNVEIDPGNTLVLENKELDFDGTEFDFVTQLNNADSAVDIVINIKKRR